MPAWPTNVSDVEELLGVVTGAAADGAGVVKDPMAQISVSQTPQMSGNSLETWRQASIFGMVAWRYFMRLPQVKLPPAPAGASELKTAVVHSVHPQ